MRVKSSEDKDQFEEPYRGLPYQRRIPEKEVEKTDSPMVGIEEAATVPKPDPNRKLINISNVTFHDNEQKKATYEVKFQGESETVKMD